MQRERDAISGSQIVTATPTPERDTSEASGNAEPGAEGISEAPILRLRLLGGDHNKPKVKWDEKVVDNELLGRKSSKICCIYHKPRAFGESSSGSSSSSSSDSDSDSDSPAPGPERPDNDLLRGIGAGGRGVYPRGAKGKGKASDESKSSSESEGGGGHGGARPARTTRRPEPLKLHKHEDGDSCGHDHSHSHSKKKSRAKLEPNAYEYDPMEKKRKKAFKKAQKLTKQESAGAQETPAAQGVSNAPLVQPGGTGGPPVEQGSS